MTLRILLLATAALCAAGCWSEHQTKYATELRIDTSCTPSEAKAIRLAAAAWAKADPLFELPEVEVTEGTNPNVLCRRSTTPQEDGSRDPHAVAWTSLSWHDEPTVYLYPDRVEGYFWNVAIHEWGHALGTPDHLEPGEQGVLTARARDQASTITGADVALVFGGR